MHTHRCTPEALKTAGGALAAASYELGSLSDLPGSPLARSPFEVALDRCHRSFSGFGTGASASNALVDLEALTSQQSMGSSKVLLHLCLVHPSAAAIHSAIALC